MSKPTPTLSKLGVAFVAVAIVVLVTFLMLRGDGERHPDVVPKATSTVPPPPRSSSLTGDGHATAGDTLGMHPDADATGPPPPWQGVVVDAFTGEPVNQANLVVTRGWSGARQRLTTTSGRDGHFSLQPIGSRWLSRRVLQVSHTHYAPRQYRLVGAIPDRIELLRGATITGRVVGPTGEAVAAADVDVLEEIRIAPALFDDAPTAPAYSLQGAARGTVTTDSDGRFSVAIGSPDVAFQARAKGYGPGASRWIRVDANGTPHPGSIVIRLGAEHVLRGRVTDAEDQGISAAEIMVSPKPEEVDPDRRFKGWTHRWRGTSGPDGHFEIKGLPRRCFNIQVKHQQYAPASHTDFDTDRELTLVMEPARWLTGRFITDTESAGAVDWLHARATVRCERATADLDIDASGSFTSRMLAGDQPTAEVFVSGFLPVTVSISADVGRFDVGEVPLDRGQRLLFRVTDTRSQPLEGASIFVNTTPRERNLGSEAITDESGRAEVWGFSDNANVTIRKHGYAEFSQVVAAEAASDLFDVVLTPHVTLTGTVVTATSQPAFGVNVVVRFASAGSRTIDRWVDGKTDLQGRFFLDEVPSETPLQMVLSRRDLPNYETAVPALTESRNDLGTIQLDAGVVAVGRVVDTDGNGVPEALVTLNKNIGGGSLTQVTETDDDGEFSLNVTPGEYRAVAQATGFLPFHPQPVVVRASPDRLLLTLTRGREFRGRVVNAIGEPVEGAEIRVDSQPLVLTDADGRFLHRSFPIEKGSIRIEHADYAKLRVDYELFSELPEVFELKPWTGLVVNLQTTSGEALPNRATLSLKGSIGTSSISGHLAQSQFRSSVVDPGGYEFTLSVSGFPTVTQPVMIGADGPTVIDITLQPKQEEVVIVAIDPLGEPVAGARVQVWDVRDTGRSNVGSGRTNTEGEFSFPLAATNAVGVDANGFAPSFIKEAASRAQQGKLAVQLDVGSILEVSVRAGDGVSLNGLQVFLHNGISDFDVHRELPLVDAGATFDGLPLGEYWLSVTRGRDTLVKEKVEISQVGTTRVELQVETPYTITGQVICNGTPVSEGGVILRKGSLISRATVTADGRFEIESRGNGVFHFVYSNRPLMYQTAVQLDGPQEILVEFDCFDVSGRVVDLDGQPVPAIKGFLARQGFETDAAGSFKLANVTPGAYQWQIQPPAGVFAPSLIAEIAGPCEVEYQLQPARLLRVNASLADGSTPERLLLYLLQRDAEHLQVNPTGTGEYVWPLHQHIGRVTTSGHASAPFTLEPDQTEVAVVLHPAGNLLIRWEREQALARVACHIQPQSDTPALHELLQGVYTLNGYGSCMLPPGNYVLSATLASGEVTMPFNIVAGETTELSP